MASPRLAKSRQQGAFFGPHIGLARAAILAKLAQGRFGGSIARRGAKTVRKTVGGAAITILGVVGIGATSVLGEDEVPVAGIYTQNQACKGDGSDPLSARVKVTGKEIESRFGVCFILRSRRSGNIFEAHVECNVGSPNLILGDITFTPRDDGTIHVVDQDQVYSAVLHKCPPGTTSFTGTAMTKEAPAASSRPASGRR